ncbi:MAG: glycosyltransferase family 4 protein [Vicinamibacteria bacterium]
MRVLFDARPANACRTGIGRYAASLSALLRDGVADHTCGSLGDDVVLAAADLREEELELPALLEREAVDLFHSPLFHLPALLPCAALVTVHDAVPLTRPDLCTPEFARLFERAGDAARRAAGVICPSEHARAEVVGSLDLDPARVHVVPEAPAACFQPLPHPEARERLGERVPEVPFLLVVGALEARKNPLLVLDALKQLPESARPYAVYAGPTGAVDVRGAARERGLARWVTVLGPVADDELVALYALAQALVFPSLHEGFGLPPLEAFACGTPVIASSAASIPEVVGDAALLFEPTDAAALARHVETVAGWSEDERAAQLERGRARLGRFSPEVVSARLAEVYGQLERGGA